MRTWFRSKPWQGSRIKETIDTQFIKDISWNEPITPIFPQSRCSGMFKQVYAPATLIMFLSHSPYSVDQLITPYSPSASTSFYSKFHIQESRSESRQFYAQPWMSHNESYWVMLSHESRPESRQFYTQPCTAFWVILTHNESGQVYGAGHLVTTFLYSGQIGSKIVKN
jgi:hypothetical protein